jgi:hypothetical protein
MELIVAYIVFLFFFQCFRYNILHYYIVKYKNYTDIKKIDIFNKVLAT